MTPPPYEAKNYELYTIAWVHNSACKLHHIYFFPKQTADCIPVVFLKWWPELSYILAELFNKCLKEACFQDCFAVFKNVGERSIYS